MAPVTSPAASDLPALVAFSTWQVTSLSGVTRRTPPLYAPGSRPAIVSTRLVPLRVISGNRTQKRSLTLQRWVFAVWHRLLPNSLASARAPFMVELFAVGRLTRSPSLSRLGPSCHQLGAPHASQVARSQRLRAPWTGFSPALKCDDFDCEKTIKAFSRRPHSLQRYRIECRYYSLPCSLGYRASRNTDYSDKPPSSWTSTSRCIQLYGQTT